MKPARSGARSPDSPTHASTDSARTTTSGRWRTRVRAVRAPRSSSTSRTSPGILRCRPAQKASGRRSTARNSRRMRSSREQRRGGSSSSGTSSSCSSIDSPMDSSFPSPSRRWTPAPASSASPRSCRANRTISTPIFSSRSSKRSRRPSSRSTIAAKKAHHFASSLITVARWPFSSAMEFFHRTKVAATCCAESSDVRCDTRGCSAADSQHWWKSCASSSTRWATYILSCANAPSTSSIRRARRKSVFWRRSREGCAASTSSLPRRPRGDRPRCTERLPAKMRSSSTTRLDFRSTSPS